MFCISKITSGLFHLALERDKKGTLHKEEEDFDLQLLWYLFLCSHQSVTNVCFLFFSSKRKYILKDSRSIIENYNMYFGGVMTLFALEEACNSCISSLIEHWILFWNGVITGWNFGKCCNTHALLQCAHIFQSYAVLTCKLLAKWDFQEGICNYHIRGKDASTSFGSEPTRYLITHLFLSMRLEQWILSEKIRKYLTALLDQGYELHYKLVLRK